MTETEDTTFFENKLHHLYLTSGYGQARIKYPTLP